MIAAKVRWTAFRRFASADGLSSGDLYMIAGARRDERTWTRVKPLYIGMSYRSEPGERIQQQHTAYRWVHEQQSLFKKDRELVVAAGEIVRTPGSRVTEALVKDVEALIICGLKPQFNTRNKTNYSGRTPLIVSNIGGAAVVFTGDVACCGRHYQAIRSRSAYEDACGA